MPQLFREYLLDLLITRTKQPLLVQIDSVSAIRIGPIGPADVRCRQQNNLWQVLKVLRRPLRDVGLQQAPVARLGIAALQHQGIGRSRDQRPVQRPLGQQVVPGRQYLVETGLSIGHKNPKRSYPSVGRARNPVLGRKVRPEREKSPTTLPVLRDITPEKQVRMIRAGLCPCDAGRGLGSTRYLSGNFRSLCENCIRPVGRVSWSGVKPELCDLIGVG